MYFQRKSTKQPGVSQGTIVKARILPIFSRDKNVLRTSFPWCNHAERESIVGNRSSEFFHRIPPRGPHVNPIKFTLHVAHHHRATCSFVQTSSWPPFVHSLYQISIPKFTIEILSRAPHHFPRSPTIRPARFSPSFRGFFD